MFRLVKLGLYCLAGYFIYEMFMGLTSESQSESEPQSRKSGGRQPARRGGATITGPGRGRKVQTEDSDGASETHVVGRGVVS